MNTDQERLLNDPGVREQLIGMFTRLYESWVNEEITVLGNKTALEAVKTRVGRQRVAILLQQIESDFSLLPFSLDPQVYRRVRERLGLSPTEGPH